MIDDGPHIPFAEWDRRTEHLRRCLTVARLDLLAAELGVTADALEALSCGWSIEDGCWTFPERDHQGRIIGIQRRWPDGTKRVYRSSQRGLYLPEGWQDRPGPLYVPEGASDVAALLSSGLTAIGRPNAKGGGQLLAKLLADEDRRIIVVGENDKKPNGDWPGRDGAESIAVMLSQVLRRMVKVTLPPLPCKDVREMLITAEIYHASH
jgi:hypothetical protein